MALRRQMRDRVRQVLTGSHADDSDAIRYAIGALNCRVNRISPAPESLIDTEIKVFSQWGEDGIIQYLVSQLPGIPETFVEIGVQDYRESNTRFLLMHDNWRGRIIDGGTDHLAFVHGSETGWRWLVDPVTAFVTRHNVDTLVSEAGLGELGLLSIDVDGMDYWLWDAVTSAQPWIVVVEYNAFFGATLPVTVPYQAHFDAATADPSWLYQGASLAALTSLAERKGYQLVGVNRNGINAFFVRSDVAGDLWQLSAADGYRPTHVRTQRDPEGELTYESDPQQILRAMRHQPLVNVETDVEQPIAEWFGV